MFERFTKPARAVVVRAQEEARGLGHSWVGSEHLLLGVLARPDAPETLARRGITAASCPGAVERVVGRGGDGIGEDDAEALRAAFGIDLEEVRSRAEDTFGPGALDMPPVDPEPGPRRLLPFRRRREREGARPKGHLPFTPRAKRALERSLRQAIALNDRHIGVEHILLGVLDPEDRIAAEVLRQLGTSSEVVRADVLEELRRAA